MNLFENTSGSYKQGECSIEFCLLLTVLTRFGLLSTVLCPDESASFLLMVW